MSPPQCRRRHRRRSRPIEKTHGLGAAWGEEENRAVVRVFDPEGETVRNYATGLRNCSGMAMQPGTDTLWCTGNERDHLGPNLVPDFLTTVQDGGFYGWPWYYTGGNEDPAHAGERPDLKDKVLVPEVLIQAHSSTLQTRLLRRGRVSGRVPRRRLRDLARVLEPGREDRIQGDPRPHEGRQADRRL